MTALEIKRRKILLKRQAIALIEEEIKSLVAEILREEKKRER